jgi:hypothetical protein
MRRVWYVIGRMSSDETLMYALENRREWELKGQGVVEMMVDKYCRDVPDEEKKASSTAAAP